MAEPIFQHGDFLMYAEVTVKGWAKVWKESWLFINLAFIAV